MYSCSNELTETSSCPRKKPILHRLEAEGDFEIAKVPLYRWRIQKSTLFSEGCLHDLLLQWVITQPACTKHILRRS